MISKEKKQHIIFAIAILVLCCLGYAIYSSGYESTDNAQIEANVVSIIPKVPGHILKMNIKDNQAVKAGDVLLQIDSMDYQIALDKANAQLDAARAKLDASSQNRDVTRVAAPSSLDSAVSQVEAAKANWEKAQADLKRFRSMDNLARSKKELDDATAAEKAAHSAYNDANAKLRSAQTAPKAIAAAEYNVKELEAWVKLAEADVAKAVENLKNTTLIAPVDGHITKRSVEEGVYVQPGQQLFAIVGNNYWVVANFKETQLTDMKPGQSVDIEIDAFPSKSFSGKVDSIQYGTGARFSIFPAENATGNFVKVVQRVPVKITFDQIPDEAIQIAPGMSVVPTVNIR
ncbi:MAG: secretion protein HlyD family protein [Rickettsiaceae bacterium]|jgi:membrane fusion protein (multidrug efflux system)|nr:secretion protein HlyD family protein [Rickettsiaceae bacterium]